MYFHPAKGLKIKINCNMTFTVDNLNNLINARLELRLELLLGDHLLRPLGK